MFEKLEGNNKLCTVFALECAEHVLALELRDGVKIPAPIVCAIQTIKCFISGGSNLESLEKISVEVAGISSDIRNGMYEAVKRLPFRSPDYHAHGVRPPPPRGRTKIFYSTAAAVSSAVRTAVATANGDTRGDATVYARQTAENAAQAAGDITDEMAVITAYTNKIRYTNELGAIAANSGYRAERNFQVVRLNSM